MEPFKRPDLTDKQKKKFQNQLTILVNESSEIVKKAWASNPEVIWDPVGRPMIASNVHNLFAARQKDKYVTLLNKVNDRRL